MGSWQSDGTVWKGIAAGIAAGLLASWVMNRFQAMVGKLTKKAEENDQH
jgi:cell division protein FtsX